MGTAYVPLRAHSLFGDDKLSVDSSQGVADYPAAIFPAELMAAYPDAKVILTVRNEDKWYDSMMKTMWHHWSAPNPAPSPMRLLSDKYQTLVWGGDFPTCGRQQFREHNAFVRSIASKERFLEWNPQEGWEPLCSFLGKEVPSVPFPRVDDWLSYKKDHST